MTHKSPNISSQLWHLKLLATLHCAQSVVTHKIYIFFRSGRELSMLIVTLGVITSDSKQSIQQQNEVEMSDM